MRKKLTDSISVQELVQMYESGMSYRDIGELLGVSYQTIRNYLNGIVTPHRRGVGGYHARRIPAPEKGPRTTQDMARQNAANACLVVEDRTISLAGALGKYVVNAAQKTILCELGGVLLELQFDAIPGLIEELKALMRNVPALNIGAEMW